MRRFSRAVLALLLSGAAVMTFTTPPAWAYSFSVHQTSGEFQGIVYKAVAVDRDAQRIMLQQTDGTWVNAFQNTMTPAFTSAEAFDAFVGAVFGVSRTVPGE